MIREIFCPIVGCGARLKFLEDFEDHYNARHTASCSVCSQVYPTSQLLSMHVSEAHDSFFQAKVARGFAMVKFLNSITSCVPCIANNQTPTDNLCHLVFVMLIYCLCVTGSILIVNLCSCLHLYIVIYFLIFARLYCCMVNSTVILGYFHLIFYVIMCSSMDALLKAVM